MSNVVSLSGVAPAALGEPKPELVALLEDLTAMAREGRLQSFVGTGFTADGKRLSATGGHHDNVYEMLGALAWLHAEYVHRNTEPDD